MKARSRDLSIVIIFLIFLQIHGQDGREFTCGKRLPEMNPLMIGAFRSNSHWPWHAAIYYVGLPRASTTTEETASDAPQYNCGGTLIDLDTVLTAAHCVSRYNEAMKAENVAVVLGKINLNVNESSSQHFQAINIIVHSEFSSSDLKNDIAIIKLSSKANYTNYVRPICLWKSIESDLSNVIGREGTVIGFGFTETDYLSNILLETNMPVVSSMSCLATNRPFFGTLLSDKNFCAGFRNGTSPCNGDSGGSMTFEENGIYYIRGIVSVSLMTGSREETRRKCDPNEYVVFTDVAKYLPWIAEVNQCEKRVHCSSLEHHADSNGLKCIVDVNITFEERNCKIIIENISNASAVTVLSFIYRRLEALPNLNNVFNKFKNIVYLDIGFTGMEFVERINLSSAQKLTWLSFYGNRLNDISPDTFDDLSEMKTLLLAANRLKSLHRDVFQQLHKLKTIWLQKNQLEVLPEGLFRNNNELENIYLSENALKIIETNFVHLSKLVAIDFRENDCIDEWCDVKEYCGSTSMEGMQRKLRNKC